ncbi:MAG TPA: NAD(P)-dependent oxidoreductase [Candidatus Limnocylindrales bacterium]
MTVVVTGAAGGVARMLIPTLEGRYPLRLTDLSDGDLTDPDFARRVTEGASAIVHLAANADGEHDWARLRGPNTDAVSNVLDAAVANGASKVILASSVHAAGGYVDAGRIPLSADWPAYPCCVYGATKVLGEALGRVYSDEHGLSVLCLRLGATKQRPEVVSELPGWLSPGDLGRLVTAALDADVRYGVYFGLSANTGNWWEIGNDIGYEPVDDSARYADSVGSDTPLAPDQRLRLLHLG